MESSYKLTFYSIIGIIVMGLIAKIDSILKSIDLTKITFWEGVQTVFVASALFVAFEMIINKTNNNENK